MLHLLLNLAYLDLLHSSFLGSHNWSFLLRIRAAQPKVAGGIACYAVSANIWQTRLYCHNGSQWVTVQRDINPKSLKLPRWISGPYTQENNSFSWGLSNRVPWCIAPYGFPLLAGYNCFCLPRWQLSPQLCQLSDSLLGCCWKLFYNQYIFLINCMLHQPQTKINIFQFGKWTGIPRGIHEIHHQYGRLDSLLYFLVHTQMTRGQE